MGADDDARPARPAPPPSSSWAALGADDDLVRPVSAAAGPPPPASGPPAPGARRGPPPPAIRPAAAPATAPAAEAKAGAPGGARPEADPLARQAPGPGPALPRRASGVQVTLPPPPGAPAAAAPSPTAPAAAPGPVEPPAFAAAPPAPTGAAQALAGAVAPAAPAPTGRAPALAGAAAPEPRPRVVLPPPPVVCAASSSDSLSGGSRDGPPGPGRRRSPGAIVALATAATACVAVPTVVFLHLRGAAAERARTDFLAEADGLSPEDALTRAEALPAGARDDPRVQKKVEGLRAAVRRRRARAAAVELLAKLPAVGTREERLALCTRALVTDDTFDRAYVERARLKLGGVPAEGWPEARRAALADLSAAIGKDPTSTLARLAEAELLARGDDAERGRARTALEAVAEADPLGATGALARGRLALLGDRAVDAEAHYTTAIARGATADGLLGRAEARLRTDDANGALTDASQAVQELGGAEAPGAEAAGGDLRAAAALALRGEARARAHHDLVGAERDATEALRRDPSQARALAVRAELRIARRGPTGDVVASAAELDQARRDAERARALDPALTTPLIVLGEVAAARGEAEDAQALLTQALERAPGTVRARLLRARLHLRAGDEDRAVADLDVVLEAAPEDLDALTLRAGAYVAQRHYGRARSDLDRVLARRELPEAYLWRGLAALLGAHQPDAAVADLTRALALEPALGDAYYYRACAHQEREAWDDCLSDLDQAERLRGPASAYRPWEVARVRGDVCYARRDWAAARAAYTRCLESAPANLPAVPLVRRRLEELRARLDGTRPGDW